MLLSSVIKSNVLTCLRMYIYVFGLKSNGVSQRSSLTTGNTEETCARFFPCVATKGFVARISELEDGEVSDGYTWIHVATLLGAVLLRASGSWC